MMRQVEPSPEASGRAAGPVYRDDSAAIQQALDGERARCRREVQALTTPLAPVYAARAGRMAAGSVLLLGAALLVAGALFLRGIHPQTVEAGRLTGILLAAWPAALVARQLARAWARRHFARRMRALLVTTDDAHSDLARLRRLDLRRHAARLLAPLAPLQRYSMAVALAGTMLLLPLGLHLLVALVADPMESVSGLWATVLGFGGSHPFSDFDQWILLSMLLVGHCHVLLAVLAWRHGRRLAAQATGPHRAGWRAYGFTVLSSVLPGVFLMFVSSVVVAVTGLFIPLLFGRAHAVVTRERDTVAQALAGGIPAAG